MQDRRLVLCLFVLVLAGSSTPLRPAVATNLAAPWRTFEIPDGAADLAIADWNRDGRMDLVAACTSPSSITLLLSGADAGFERRDLSVIHMPRHIAVGDFNRDGRPDIAAVGYGSSVISIYLGRADGGIDVAAGVPLSAASGFIVTADVDGDGLPDLVVSSPTAFAGQAFAFLGNGDGTFRAGVASSLPLDAGSLAVGDANGDGRPDLFYVGGSFTNFLGASLGNGDGTFTAQPYKFVGVGGGLAVADWNGDGTPDAAVGTGHSVTIFPGVGDGTFSDGIATALPLGGALTTADLDGDGRPDLVAGGAALLHQSAFTFAPPIPLVEPPNIVKRVVADFDGDGKADVAGLMSDFYPFPDQVTMAFGHGDGHFGAGQMFATAARPTGIAAGDLNGDGHPDLAVAALSQGVVAVHFNRSDGTFLPPVLFSTGDPTYNSPFRVAIGDLDGDGRNDVACSYLAVPLVSVFHATGGGGFGPRVDLDMPGTEGTVAFGDLDGDGIADLVATSRYNTSSTVSVFLGRRDGSTASRVDLDGGPQPMRVAIGDLDGDGHPDLVVDNVGEYLQPGTVKVLLGNGNGTFRPGAAYPTGPSPTSVALADLDSNGHLDAVTADLGGNGITVLLGNGTGALSALPEVPTAFNPWMAVVGDLDGDGRLDVAAASNVPNVIAVHRGEGTGQLDPPELFGVPTQPQALALSDFDGDGLLDVAAAGEANNTITVMRNLGLPIYADAGPDRTAECASANGTPVLLDGSGSTGANLTFQWSAPGVTFDDAGSPKPTGLFPNGVTTVTLEVHSGAGTATDETIVTVADHEAPTLALTATPSLLWPPNHKLADITVTADVRDACDPHPALRLTSITSSEPQTSNPEIVGADVGTDDRAFSLRSDRTGDGPGRVYVACYEARDASGNARTACVTITVPHDRGERAELSTGNTTLVLFGGNPSRVSEIVPGSVEIRSDDFEHLVTVTWPPAARDVDGDGYDDAVFGLPPSTVAALQSTSVPLFVRWQTASGASIAPLAHGTLGVNGPSALAFTANVWPNPARRDAALELTLPASGVARVTIYDVAGHVVARPVDGWHPAGRLTMPLGTLHGPQVYWYRAEWQGRHIDGKFVTMR